MRSDKIISKLLDMSVLASDLGGSIPVCEPGEPQATTRRLRGLQECMNSVDLRVIKSMEQDYRKSRRVLDGGEGIHLVAYLSKIKRVPLEVLDEQATRIQRFWRKKTSQSVIPYYTHLFFRNPAINSRAAIEENIDQISDILGDKEQD